jgi:hypothetical protein
MSENDKFKSLQSLQSENQILRDLIVSLAAALLRNIALHPPHDRDDDPSDAERLVQEADECFRCARLPGLKQQIAEGLQAAGHEFLAKAVEIETKLEREKRKK